MNEYREILLENAGRAVAEWLETDPEAAKLAEEWCWGRCTLIVWREGDELLVATGRRADTASPN